MRAKRAIAAKMLHDAYIHLMGRRSPELAAAEEVLMEAERRVRNGFGTMTHQQWSDAIDLSIALEVQYGKV